MNVGTQVGLGHGHNLLDGDPAPHPPKGHRPKFSAHIRCGKMAAWIKLPLGMEVDLGPGRIVLHEDPARPSQKRHSPQFSAHVYCGQTVAHLSYSWSPIVVASNLRNAILILVCRSSVPPSQLKLGRHYPRVHGPCWLHW